MKNQISRDLHAYWNHIRRGRFAPWRSEIEPADIHMLLPDIFIIETTAPDHYQFRLAGTRICSAYRRELKGQNFMKLWSDQDREGFETVLHNVARDGAVGIITLTGTSDREHSVRFEMIIMPLRHHDGKISRFIGAMTTGEAPYWLGTNPIVRQSADSVRLLWPQDQSDNTLRVVNHPEQTPGVSVGRPARRVGHLSIYDGGRAD